MKKTILLAFVVCLMTACEKLSPDDVMAEITIPYFIDKQPFNVYYMTVRGIGERSHVHVHAQR